MTHFQPWMGRTVAASCLGSVGKAGKFFSSAIKSREDVLWLSPMTDGDVDGFSELKPLSSDAITTKVQSGDKQLGVDGSS